MTYRDRLRPWCIIRQLTNKPQIVVARFQRRSDAEAYLKILKQLLPTAPYTIIFEAALNNQENRQEVQS